jgi:hypothetical protein
MNALTKLVAVLIAIVCVTWAVAAAAPFIAIVIVACIIYLMSKDEESPPE